MTDYIKRSDALKVIETANSMVSGLLEATMKLRVTMDKIAAADVAPVRHGRWIDKCVRDWRCSECGGEIYKVRHVDGYYYDNLPRYCPDCGALMDKDGDGDV